MSTASVCWRARWARPGLQRRRRPPGEGRHDRDFCDPIRRQSCSGQEVIKEKDKLDRFVERRIDWEGVCAIRDLRATEADFSDELFALFTADQRRRIIFKLPLLVQPGVGRKIFERRSKCETDEFCKRVLDNMISVLNELYPE